MAILYDEIFDCVTLAAAGNDALRLYSLSFLGGTH